LYNLVHNTLKLLTIGNYLTLSVELNNSLKLLLLILRPYHQSLFHHNLFMLLNNLKTNKEFITINLNTSLIVVLKYQNRSPSIHMEYSILLHRIFSFIKLPHGRILKQIAFF